MLEAKLNDRCPRKLASKKNIQGIDWYMTLGRDISSYEEFQCKTTKSLSLSLSSQGIRTKKKKEIIESHTIKNGKFFKSHLEKRKGNKPSLCFK